MKNINHGERAIPVLKTFSTPRPFRFVLLLLILTQIRSLFNCKLRGVPIHKCKLALVHGNVRPERQANRLPVSAKTNPSTDSGKNDTKMCWSGPPKVRQLNYGQFQEEELDPMSRSRVFSRNFKLAALSRMEVGRPCRRSRAS